MLEPLVEQAAATNTQPVTTLGITAQPLVCRRRHAVGHLIFIEDSEPTPEDHACPPATRLPNPASLHFIARMLA
jgi:hypothetical protein